MRKRVRVFVAHLRVHPHILGKVDGARLLVTYLHDCNPTERLIGHIRMSEERWHARLLFLQVGAVPPAHVLQGYE
jgi:hypothetical protein